MATKEQNGNFEGQLFKAADKLRKNIDAAEYKNVALGLIFLKYISESFQELYDKLAKDEFSDPEDRDEYKAENIFFVPEQARWKNLQAKAKLPTIGQELDDAMESIEKENSELRNVLPKVFGKPNLDKTSLGQLIDLISNTELKATSENSKDLFGRVYEYFLGEFANAEGKKGGQFYTPKSIVKLMVEMIEPYKGRVYDPACGSGGMFVMSEKFVQEHQGNIKDITVYGQESNQTTWKLSKMNLAIRNINSQFVAWNTEGSFLKDAHPDLKADYILANPPFNQSDWGQEILQDDARWKYGVPPSGNANFGWMQHMLYHLATNGVMATVLANGSLSSNTSGEGEIRKNLIENDLVECIVALPDKLFYNTGISACIWFLKREKQTRKGEVLFIDASKMGQMKDSTHRDFLNEDITTIKDIYHNWKNGDISNIKGIAISKTIQEIEENTFNLLPSKYISYSNEQEYSIPFEEKLGIINEFLYTHSENERKIDTKISNILGKHFSFLKWENLNYSSNEVLEEILQSIYYEWIGKNSDSDNLPENWKVGCLGEIVEIFDSERKPLSSVQRTKMKGEFPYYGATSIMDYVNDFLFDGTYLLFAEDGSVMDANGFPILQYVYGKFWVNNHAHVLQGKNGFSTELLYVILKKAKVASIVNGAVQLKINKTNLLNLNIIIPDDKTLLKINEVVLHIFEKIKINDRKTKDIVEMYKGFISNE